MKRITLNLKTHGLMVTYPKKQSYHCRIRIPFDCFFSTLYRQVQRTDLSDRLRSYTNASRKNHLKHLKNFSSRALSTMPLLQFAFTHQPPLQTMMTAAMFYHTAGQILRSVILIDFIKEYAEPDTVRILAAEAGEVFVAHKEFDIDVSPRAFRGAQYRAAAEVEAIMYLRDARLEFQGTALAQHTEHLDLLLSILGLRWITEASLALDSQPSLIRGTSQIMGILRRGDLDFTRWFELRFGP